MSSAEYFEKDFYKVLGVDKSASKDEIRKAYRKLAREHHPDANRGDKRAEERFKDISEAYSVLSDESKRAEYDRVREMVGAGGFRGFGAGRARAGSVNFDLSDLLGNLFGEQPASGTFTRPRRTGGVRGPRRGGDVTTEVTLSFEEALAGVTVTLRLTGDAVCSTCTGLGARPGTAPLTCTTCQGSGVVADNQGMFSFSQPCPVCAGRGMTIPDPCPTCNGSGIEQRPRSIRARIPAGVKDGATVRLKGKGEPGVNGGPAGDLFVTVNIREHQVFGRQGDHLTITVPVTFAEAALGAQVRVPTLDGPVTVKIPPGTESGTTFRVRGKGAPGKGDRRGDLLVTVQVAVPRKLTKTQKKALEEYARMDDAEQLRAHLDALIAGAS